MTRPEHSILGASGAERWMRCPGSVALIESFHLPETDEPEYRTHGTTAHEAAAVALREGLDSWELIGRTFGKHEVSVEMAEAVQVYLDECRRIMEEHPGGEVYIEQSIDLPDFHPYFYGTTDFGYIDHTTGRLYIRDFKYGIGVAVDVEHNPQIMYYGFGLLSRSTVTINLGIVQPRAFHPAGIIRTWELSADDLEAWANTELRPAMERALLENDFLPGEWCRFCPAKLVCPVMKSLFRAAMTADAHDLSSFTDDDLGRNWALIGPVKGYIQALEKEAMARLQRGVRVPGIKMVAKRADRVFKDGAEQIFRMKYGPKAFTDPEFKSPAQMEKLGKEAKDMLKEWAYTPQVGYTVALETDKRPGIIVQSVSDTFAADLNNYEAGK